MPRAAWCAALLLALLAAAAAQDFSDSNALVWEDVDRESFPNGITIPENIVIITVPSVLVVALIVAVAVQTALTGSARLPVLLLAMQLVAVLVTGLSTWVVTYSAAVTVIEDHASRLLVFAGLTASVRTTADLTHGAVLVEQIAAAARSGNIRMNEVNQYPDTHRQLASIALIAGYRSGTFSFAYFGNEYGDLHGVWYNRLSNGSIDDRTVGLSIGIGPGRCREGQTLSPTQACPRSPELQCESNDAVWETCRHRACASNASGDCELCLTYRSEVQDDPDRCPGCRPCDGWVIGGIDDIWDLPSDLEQWDLPPQAGVIPGWCEPTTRPLGVQEDGRIVVQGFKRDGSPGRRWVGAPGLRGDEYCSYTFDPRVRPWYTREHGMRWSPVYEFARSGPIIEMGITATMAVPNPRGNATGYHAGVPAGNLEHHPWLGVIAVDFGFTSISKVLSRLLPTAGSVLLVSDTEGTLVAGSLPTENMTTNTTTMTSAGLVTTLAPVKVLNAGDWVNHDLVDVFPLVVRKYGTLREAAEHRAILMAKHGVVFNQPMRVVGGLLWLMVVYMPFSDITEQSQERATVALAIAVVICFSSGLLVSLVVALLLRPLHALSQRMNAVAQMDLDAHPCHGGVTTEVKNMAADFQVMVDSLKGYRNFLPQAVLERLDEGAEELSAPRGTVAIMFSDIVGSTKLWEEDPNSMAEALELHNTAIRAQVRAHRGYEVKTIGDAFMISFGDPVDAVACGMAVQEQLLRVEWPRCDFNGAHPLWAPQRDAKGALVWNGIAVRIGIGYAQAQDEVSPITGRCDYRGRAVNLASRLESTAPHGAVQISEQCYSAVKGHQRFKQTDFREAPPREMKGIGLVRSFFATPPGLMQRLPSFFAPAPGKGCSPLSGPAEPPGTHDPPLLIVRRRSTTSGIHSQGSVGRPDSVHTGSSRGSIGDTPRSAADQATASVAGQERSLREGSVAVLTRIDGAASETLGGVDSLKTFDELARGASHVVTGAMRTQGKVLSVLGGEAVCCWNIVSPCGPHEWMALCFVSIVLPSSKSPVIGLAAGMQCRGYVGSGRSRFFSVSGFPVLCAREAAAEAARQRYRCISCYPTRPPDSVKNLMYPVDAWRASTASGAAATISVEVPVTQLIKKELARQQDQTDLEGCAPSADETVQRLRSLFEEALGGSKEALQSLRVLVEQEGAKMTAELASTHYQWVLDALGALLAASPQGSDALRPAPFLRGPVCADSDSPGWQGSAEVFASDKGNSESIQNSSLGAGPPTRPFLTDSPTCELDPGSPALAHAIMS
eukprot:TRINITY_DN4409_c2_g1_i1.p1 TRINITY_DN4409_c2_g1~~TRINITY_DN4409_c2_g1_i1.p1  ORF type:complete len:1318 (+),score=301.89 TRINITY_DN4409_c2_g1_i1:87-3956(+)